MDNNYMEQVAKIFGLELEETFKIKLTDTGISAYGSEDDTHTIFKFTKDHLIYYSEDLEDWMISYDMLTDLLYGNYEPVKLPQKKTIVISAFPASGKTYACDLLTKEGYKVLDSDSSKFSWLPYKDPQVYLRKNGDVDIVKGYTPRNPEFPQNYINHIKENIGKVDYIFVSSHKEVRDALIENNIPFKLVYPYRPLKAEWIGRCYLRDGNTDLCDKLVKNWDKWIDEIEVTDSDLCNRYELDEYFPNLYDLIKHNIEGK